MTGHALPRLTEEQFRLSTAERAAGTGSSNRKGRLPRRVLLVLVAGPIGQWRATSASSRNFGEFSRNCKRLKCASSHNFRRKFDREGRKGVQRQTNHASQPAQVTAGNLEGILRSAW